MNQPGLVETSHDGRLSRRLAVTRKADEAIHQARAGFNLGHLLPWIPRGSSVVDVGAGDGLLASAIRDQAQCEVRGFDIEARELADFAVELYDGHHIPVEDQTFDIAICVAVLHHCDDIEQVVREIARVTRHRFLLIEDRFDSKLDELGVIGFHHYLNWVEKMPFNPGGFKPTHEWRRLLEHEGFLIRRTVPMGRSMRWVPIHNTLIVAEKPSG
ncbi:MAG: methyltransferase domain-containing protein [Phycisphaeraceae bacterium]|nr:methyltransferase domain-containing protein [Phycisphaeraceae bacterium]